MGEWTARAEQLAEELTEYGARASQLCARCRASGLDPDAYRALVGAALTLGGAAVATRDAQPLRDDHDFAQALDALEADLADLAAELEHQRQAAGAALGQAHADLAGAETDEERAAAHARIADLEEAVAILDSLDARVRHARARLAAVPDDLGGTYLAAYRLVKAGRRMPHDGRWLETA